MGHEWAHAEIIGQGEGLLVVDFGSLALRRLAPRRNLAEEVQSIRLVAPFLVFTGECQRLFGEGVRLRQVASQHLRLTQGETTERLKASHVRSAGLLHRRREQRHGIGNAPGQSICCP